MDILWYLICAAVGVVFGGFIGYVVGASEYDDIANNYVFLWKNGWKHKGTREESIGNGNYRKITQVQAPDEDTIRDLDDAVERQKLLDKASKYNVPEIALIESTGNNYQLGDWKEETK